MIDTASPVPPSIQARLIARGLRQLVKPRQVSRADIPVLRALMFTLTRSRLPAGIRVERVRMPRGEWLRPEQPRRGRALLYFHGGGYFCGAPRSHRAITARLARHLAIPVFSLDYRLAPEHPFPAALEDALGAWEWLLDQGYRPDRIWLGGDSAGGGLALAFMLASKARDLPLPAGAVLFSPWTDLTCGGASISDNVARCAWFLPDQIRFAAGLYGAGAALDNPLISPLFGQLAGLPPLVIHASDSELLRDDSIRLADKALATGVKATLKIWHGLPHAWPNFAGLMPEADICLAETAEAILTSASPLPRPAEVC